MLAWTNDSASDPPPNHASAPAGPRPTVCGTAHSPGLVVPPAVSAAPPVKDLFAQDVGVAGVLREFTQHL
jgi:hypothetical protein